ncbi:dihydrolipoyl dehydrogenase [Paenibacillus larvae subsp. larvae]|uniref:dihydrolipoyl dehydrogenase n=1 Tax=Paenibacillus larvae TaxID=1464 RepID=UPI0023A9FAD3|nr:dihydrolipoyl dehydrogenase [Paenibacillus larvae]MDE5128433.1 dihydrolipoyl dehydrogenase [Paenibacillus larvae subsp. larvae]MDE5136139.1 dihydrolipoyl dehydrogenase [Paenibacillus larvae subsp. larvae]MDE5140176.1 dihydrolipoyl dehydrogenase [Paenibacillus larvae subsp. larvae]MDE5142035.1 dihydrolipoyl dehydrogenase [Paenibacillus larvae subsp. larvae]MDE5152078.1 dihydrolipoyl dehydrogenase [Paenibacillus larvae subsp. larvae]
MVVGDASLDIDVLVIGAGPGGYVAAIRAAQLGKSVLIVDKSEWGGVCLNRGCIPSKALISAAHNYETMSHSESMGISAEGVKVDFGKVQEWKNSVVKKLTGGVSSLLKGNKVQMFQGEAMFINEHEARVFNEHEAPRYRFKHCIIATGSRPIELKPFPFGGRILSSTEALQLKEIPKSMVVIGGGYIGIELGQTFAKFGTKVTVLEGSETILPGFEKDLSKLVAKNLKKLNVEIYTEAMAQSSEQTDKDVTVTFTVKGEEKKVTADYVLVTVGRRPNTDGELGLDLINVKMTERGLIEVDKQARTSIPHIFAIGDIVPGAALAHKASYEGKVAAEAIAGMPSEVDYKAIPAVVFSDPEIASVGLNETEAKAKGINVATGKFPYAANGRALSLNATDGFVKVVANKDTGIVLGCQIVGPEASNLIAELGLAIEMGAALEDIALTIHAHPTLGEIVMEAAEGALGHPIHMMGK